MSAWLGRPNLIDQKHLSFEYPVLRLDESTAEPNLLSPFAHMALQAKLGRAVASALGGARSGNILTAGQVSAVESACEKFIEQLPPIFQVLDPDTSHDEEHSWIIFQRRQMHCVIFITMLDFLKPFLTMDRRDRLTDNDDEFRKRGVDIALRLIEVAKRLFDHEFPINAKFHLVVFAIFDVSIRQLVLRLVCLLTLTFQTATVLCSAIIHDREHMLPHREEMIAAIHRSLAMLQQLSPTTKLGSASHSFLHKLVQATPEISGNVSTKKRRTDGNSLAPSSAQLTAQVATLPTSDPIVNPMDTAVGDATTTAVSDQFSFYPDVFLATNPFDDLPDLGGMGDIWEYQNLHLDRLPQYDFRLD